MIARKLTILDLRIFTDMHAVEVTTFVGGEPVTVTLHMSFGDAQLLRNECAHAPAAFMETVAARLNDLNVV